MPKKYDFFLEVHEVVKLIPKGKVTTYGAIAEHLGTKKGARTVGYAMNATHTLEGIPAHRVVNRNGLLTGRNQFSYPNEMQDLLELEGHRIIDNQIIDFISALWTPHSELL